MANVDEVLATMDTPEEAEKVILVIDEDLRVVTIPSKAIVIGAKGDKDVNRIWFKMSRYYRGTDMGGFTPRVNYTNAAGKHYFYLPTDMACEDGKTLAFSWLIGDKAAEANGSVTFSVCLRQMNGDDVIKEFNSTIATVQCLVSNHEETAEDDTEVTDAYAVLDEAILDETVLG